MNHHHHDTESELTFEEKLHKLLDHWIKHNEDHAETYRNWKEKAEEHDMKEAAALLEEAAELNIEINKKFKEALNTLKK